MWDGGVGHGWGLYELLSCWLTPAGGLRRLLDPFFPSRKHPEPCILRVRAASHPQPRPSHPHPPRHCPDPPPHTLPTPTPRPLNIRVLCTQTLRHPNPVWLVTPQSTPHTLHANPEQQGLLPSRLRLADPKVSWSETHLLTALPAGLPGWKAAGPRPSRGSYWPAGAPAPGSDWSNNHTGVLQEGRTAGVPSSPGHLGWGRPATDCPVECPHAGGPRPRLVSGRPPRGRGPGRALSLGPWPSTTPSGEATPGRPVHRAPRSQSPPPVPGWGRVTEHSLRRSQRPPHKTFPHVGLGKLEGRGNVYPGLEALEK